jgi:hypothetical protein|tara:strand:- start:1421 stop:1597 length:177 start_codon:yes stop_codon:yes gene_type:complete
LRIKADDNDQNNDDYSENDFEDSSCVEIPFEEGNRYVNLLDLTGENSQFLGSDIFPEG